MREVGKSGSHSLPPHGLPVATLPSGEAGGRDTASWGEGGAAEPSEGPRQWGQDPQVGVLLRQRSWCGSGAAEGGEHGQLLYQSPEPQGSGSSADHAEVPPPFSVGSDWEGLEIKS